ncbi:uncharacterized protein LOC128666463 [Bombina bombina]|uniref:uncharacterized protein LOC128666463 n=1 Tax=Bombina bombina TaxID=8345 RepID=UPI00235B1C76|nr:uncharacterized protein LOC128666463 [Bombina bombina]
MGLSVLWAFVFLINLFGTQVGSDAVQQNHATPAPNIALQGITSQSSTYTYYGNSRNANDGSLANNYLRSQCSHTKKEKDPWWMVDLKEKYHINSVAITNRVLECCRERIFGAEIRIGNDPTNGGTLNPRCGVIASIESGETLSFSCHGMIGQYVSVTLPGKEEPLVLCEVQVFGQPVSSLDVPEPQIIFKTPNGAPNVAQKGVATQSSLYNMYGESKNAIDGSLSSNYLFIECAGTSEQDNPWWMVDLKSRYQIFTVAVTNRGDCCANRINGAEIRIGNSEKDGGTHNTVCGIITSMDNGETLAFECGGMEGQYVTVHIPGSTKSVTICEVQVFGLPAEFTEQQISTSEPDKEFLDNFSIFDLFDFDLFSEEDDDSEHTINVDAVEGDNLAFRGISSQSSTYDKFGDSENAIDGSKNTKYMSGHCSHTDLDIEPWWRVDLTATFNVTLVKITNRGDCCNERIKGAEIRIGNSPERGGTKNPRCARIESMDLGKEETFRCGMVGRYVTVTIPDRAAYLTLCEVKVFGEEYSGNDTTILFPIDGEDSEESHVAAEWNNILKHSNAATNIALNGLAYQSSIDEEGGPHNAVDGSLNNANPTTQCAITKKDNGPWWTLDLKSEHKIFSIAITNRGDCCSDELDGAVIHVGNEDVDWKNNTICGTISSIGLGETFSFNCDEMQGRFINIHIPDKEVSLTLCEVQVFGLPVDTPGGEWKGDLELQKKHHGLKNIASQGIPSQSSNYGKINLKVATDGSLASNYLAGDCIHTNKDYQPWWKLDFKYRMRIQSVAVTNRGDCCRERINGAEIHIGDSKDNDGMNNPRCAVIFRMGYGETLSFNCKGLEGRFLYITIPDRAENLALCEVQVFAEPLEKMEVIPTSLPAELTLAESPFITTKNLIGKSLVFKKETGDSYVILTPDLPMNLKAFTLCMKLSLDVPQNRETILFSYRTTFYDELNLWIEYDGKTGFYMSGDGVQFAPMDLSKEWNHVCLTWEARHGRTEFWLNGRRATTAVYNKKNIMRAGGIVMLGQDQDNLGGDFDISQSYVGKIKDLNMWDSVLSLKLLKKQFNDKDIRKGNIFDWGHLSYKIFGNVTIV